jgi:D-xylose-proton symporter
MSSIPASSQRSRITPLVIRSAVVAAIGGLIFGFDTAVISGATDTLKDVFHLSEFGKGFLVAIATIGTIFGAIIGGRRPGGLRRPP